MSRILFGIFIVLHGLVHLWYFTLSQRLVEFRPEMGWSGRSWILSSQLSDSLTRTLASGLYVLATVIFVVSGVGVFLQAGWLRPVLVVAAVFSSATIMLFWDGSMELLVQKGLIGLLINGALLIVVLVLNWPETAF